MGAILRDEKNQPTIWREQINWWLVVAVVVGGPITYNTYKQDQKEHATRAALPPDYSAAARQMCKEFIERRMHDPGSADWGKFWDWPTHDLGGDKWSVTATYRAKNGFGALRLGTTYCVMKRTGDNWQLLQS